MVGIWVGVEEGVSVGVPLGVVEGVGVMAGIFVGSAVWLGVYGRVTCPVGEWTGWSGLLRGVHALSSTNARHEQTPHLVSESHSRDRKRMQFSPNQSLND